jgi:hypothetical protein
MIDKLINRLVAEIDRLQAENARLRDDVRQLAERVAICSELLSRRAEKQPAATLPRQ